MLLSKLLVCSDYARICYSGHFLSAYLDQSHNVSFSFWYTLEIYVKYTCPYQGLKNYKFLIE